MAAGALAADAAATAGVVCVVVALAKAAGAALAAKRANKGGGEHRQRFVLKVNPKVMLFVMLVGAFVSSTAYSMLTSALPAIMTEFSVDATLGQLLTTAYIYVLGITSAMTAFLITRYSSRLLFLLALASAIWPALIAVVVFAGLFLRRVPVWALVLLAAAAGAILGGFGVS